MEKIRFYLGSSELYGSVLKEGWKIKFVKSPFHFGMLNEERGRRWTKRHSSKATKIKEDRQEGVGKQINKVRQPF